MTGKISELTAATTASAADQVELLQGGVNKRAALSTFNAALLPLMQNKILGNLSNTVVRHTKGSVNTAGNQTSSTFHALMLCPSPRFTHVQIILKNKEAVPPNGKFIVAVTNTATTFTEKTQPSVGNTITNDGSSGWVEVTFNGVSSVSTPVALPFASGPTGDAALLVSDRIPLNSLDPVDGSPFPRLMIRGMLDKNFTYMAATVNATDNTHQDYFESFRQAGVDGVSVPANFSVPTANDPNSIIFGAIFTVDEDVIGIACVGDSITMGLHTSPGSDTLDTGARSWVCLSAEAALAASLPLNFYNIGCSGYTTTSYSAVGKRFVALCRPSVVMYSVYSPNDGTPTQAMMDAMYARALDFARYALAKGTIPIFTFLAPNENIASGPDNLRKALIAKVKTTGFPVLDGTIAIGDGATPEKFVSGDKFDTLHPSLAGQTALFNYIYPKVLSILAQNYNF